MDYAAEIKRVYEQLDNDQVDKAVMTCLRLARTLKDYFSAAIFLRELRPNKRQFLQVFYEDTSELKKEERKFLFDASLEHWLDGRTLEQGICSNGDEDDERNVLVVGIGEIDADIRECERSIGDMTLASGMSPFDTAYFTNDLLQKKGLVRLRIQALHCVKERVRTRCFNYAIRLERQLSAQSESETFLHRIQNQVSNYFKAHSEDVYIKLQGATRLIDTDNPEDRSLLLAEVRRAIKAAADHFYPPACGPVKCADGKERSLGDDQYLNRLEEYLSTAFRGSSSRDLLEAELGLLAVFVRRLNEVASKGVHSEVSAQEAKQGLVGLYMFLYNLISRLRDKSP